GGETIEWNNPDASVMVSVPYVPTVAELEDLEHIVIWYLDGKGNVIEVPSGRYDAEKGIVTFSTTHFSRYTVSFVTKTFVDLGSAAWAKEKIEILASKGILEGQSDNKYEPKSNITRADFLCFLVRTLSIDTNFEGNFSDISSDAYYFNEIGVAKELGITTGTGKHRFYPDAEISRQDMIVLTERTLKILNKLEKKGISTRLDQFSDKSKISAYALDSISSIVEEGLIVGNGSKLNPRGNTTRAEAAMFLYRIYDKYSRPVK
ncbi:MAG TPA: S-layer homology domain-containing protein, partial [Anaerovoracaceae bacterium]|nr:S-layer homology domain-containing protein [Anaerovoracaceae bacterium]